MKHFFHEIIKNYCRRWNRTGNLVMYEVYFRKLCKCDIWNVPEWEEFERHITNNLMNYVRNSSFISLGLIMKTAMKL